MPCSDNKYIPQRLGLLRVVAAERGQKAGVEKWSSDCRWEIAFWNGSPMLLSLSKQKIVSQETGDRTLPPSLVFHINPTFSKISA